MRLLYFTADWCVPCRKFGPTLATVAGELGHDIRKLDVDEHPELALAYKVMSVPTVVVVDQAGELVDQFGSLPATALRERLAS